MGQLIVRNVDDDLIRALKRRAAEHGHSAEAEHRAILRSVLDEKTSPKSLRDALLEIPPVGDDSDFERPRDTGRELRL